MPNKKISELSPRTPSLTDLMIVGDPASGYSYKATLNVLTTFVGNNLQFADLGGIALSSPTNGQVLTFNGTNWVNQTLSVPVQECIRKDRERGSCGGRLYFDTTRRCCYYNSYEWSGS
jgi:hypothetical protein